MFYQKEEDIDFTGFGYQLNLTFANLGITNATEITRDVINTYLQTQTTTPLPVDSSIYITITETAVSSTIYGIYHCKNGYNFVADIDIYRCNLVGYNIKNSFGYITLNFDSGNPCEVQPQQDTLTMPINTASAFASVLGNPYSKLSFIGKSNNLNVAYLVDVANNKLRIPSFFNGVHVTWILHFSYTTSGGSDVFYNVQLHDDTNNKRLQTPLHYLANINGGENKFVVVFNEINVGNSYLVKVYQDTDEVLTTYRLDKVECIINAGENYIAPQIEINTN